MGIHIFHRLKQLIAQSTFFISTIGIRVKTRFDFWTTRNYSKIREVNSHEKHGHKNLAIVALYPRPGTLNSTLRLIDSLSQSDYSVLAVINDSKYTDEWITALSAGKSEILVRPNIGRDFGAFKAGFLFAKRKGALDNIDKLVFANDSVFYGPKSVDFVKTLLAENYSWLSMFVNYQFHTHAQSFFQVFGKEIFSQSYFSNFWENYYPSELRHHAINFGEVGLSSICIKGGYSPVSFVSADLILNSPDFQEFTPDEKFGIWGNHGLTYLNQDYGTFDNTKFLMKRQYLDNNITHHQGLLASRVLKAPLKLDIFQTGQVTKEGLSETLNALGCNEPEIRQTLEIMTLKGSHSSRRGLQRIWSAFGYV
jgi:hypothetical protein